MSDLHNPANVSPANLPEGRRFMTQDERKRCHNNLLSGNGLLWGDIWFWASRGLVAGEWIKGSPGAQIGGCFDKITYCVPNDFDNTKPPTLQ